MIGLVLSFLIDVIDASQIGEITVIGMPIIAIAEGAIIYYTTRSKTLAIIGMAESVIPIVNILPFATIAWVIRHGKLIGWLILGFFAAIMFAVIYWFGWIRLPF